MSAARLKKVTVLDGYYASGDYECFCFDKLDGPDAYSHMNTDEQIAAQELNRVYPGSLLPRGANYGRWRITVEFESLLTEAEHRPSPISDAPLCNLCFRPADEHAYSCPHRPLEHVEADCGGLNADGTCPHGFGRTCCAVLRPPTPEGDE